MSEALPDGVVPGFRERVRTTDWPRLVAMGIISFMVGFVLVGALTFVGTPPTTQGLVGAVLTIGFAFYSAHNIPLSVVGGGQFDFLGSIGSLEVPASTYYAVPIVVLLVAGYVANSRLQSGNPISATQTLLNGFGLGVGYVLMALVGTFAFRTQINNVGDVVIPFDLTLILAGAYVLAFGILGAAVASAVVAFRRV